MFSFFLVKRLGNSNANLLMFHVVDDVSVSARFSGVVNSFSNYEFMCHENVLGRIQEKLSIIQRNDFFNMNFTAFETVNEYWMLFREKLAL